MGADKGKIIQVNNAKKQALESAIMQIEKQFGKGSIMKLGEKSCEKAIDVISTGCVAIDKALGVGGVPRGRIVEIFGPESSGKTTVTLHIIAEAQKKGGIAAFIDAEHALDPVYANGLGVDLDELFVSQPDSGEQALEIVESLTRSGAVDVIVIDSVAALTPRAEIDGLMGDAHVGNLARLMAQALRKLTSVINKSNTCVIFINQLRDKIGGGLYGPNETTPGGKALKFFSSIRLDVRKGETIKEGTTILGSRAKIKVVKNKLAPPFKIAEFDMMFGRGICKAGALLDVALEYGIIKRSGAWFSYLDNKIGQGRENVKTFLLQNPQVMNEIDEKCRTEIAKEQSKQCEKIKEEEQIEDFDETDNSEESFVF